MKKLLLASAACLLAAGNVAHANIITGSIWEGITEPFLANPASVPGGAPNVTFSVSAINFDSRLGVNDYTIGGFLNSTGTLTNVFTGSGELGNTSNDTIWDFKGQVTVTNGQTFNVAHDDGLTLIIGGVTVVDQPGPTPPANTLFTWSGLSGTYNFDLVYGECCGPPAVLSVDLPFIGGQVPGETPLPAALPLFAAGAGVLGIFARRRKKKAALATA